VDLLRDRWVRPRGRAVVSGELEGQAGRGVVGGHDNPVVALSPFATRHILRFGDYVLYLSPPTSAVSTHLELDVGAGSVGPPIKS